MSDGQRKQLALAEIQDILKRNGCTLDQYEGMKVPDHVIIGDGSNKLIVEEMTYNVEDMRAEHDKLYPCLTDEQRDTYHEIMGAIESFNGGVFFV